MTPLDTPLLSENLINLADAIGGKAPTQAGMKVWIQTLREFPINEIVDVLTNWAKRATKMPAPADVWKSLNDARAERMESDAATRKREYEHEAKQTMHRNPVIAQKLSALLAEMRGRPKNDPKEWASNLMNCYLLDLPGPNGKPLSLLQIQFACSAMGRMYSEVQAERDAHRRSK